MVVSSPLFPPIHAINGTGLNLARIADAARSSGGNNCVKRNIFLLLNVEVPRTEDFFAGGGKIVCVGGGGGMRRRGGDGKRYAPERLAACSN